MDWSWLPSWLGGEAKRRKTGGGHRQHRPHAPIARREPVAATSPTDDGQATGGNEVRRRRIPAGKVLTAQGAKLGHIPDETRALCALFEDGRFYVSASHAGSTLVRAVKVDAVDAGLPVHEPELVSPEVIAKIYQHAAREGSGRVEESVVRRKVEELLSVAHASGVSDIHMEVIGDECVIDFQVDGLLYEHERWPAEHGRRAIQAIFNNSTAQSDTSRNEMAPQSGMLAPATKSGAIRLPESMPGVRWEAVRVQDGSYLVMRLHQDDEQLVGAGQSTDALVALGFSLEQAQAMQRLWRIPFGGRVIAGPMGQGKTVTFRVAITNRLDEHRVKTSAKLNALLIEDPPEGGIRGARQMMISASHGEERREVEFGEIERSVLRLAPHVVLLGEVRDKRSADFAFRLAMTGVQAWWTLHVYLALAIPQRLRDLGVEPYLVYDHNLLRGLISQRLIRKLCPKCRKQLVTLLDNPRYGQLAARLKVALADMEQRRAGPLEEEGAVKTQIDISSVYVAKPDGCEECTNGYRGRTAVAEVIETDATLMHYLRGDDFEAAENYWLSPTGLRGVSMLWHSLEKVMTGDVSPETVEDTFGPLATERAVMEFTALEEDRSPPEFALVGE